MPDPRTEIAAIMQRVVNRVVDEYMNILDHKRPFTIRLILDDEASRIVESIPLVGHHLPPLLQQISTLDNETIYAFFSSFSEDAPPVSAPFASLPVVQLPTVSTFPEIKWKKGGSSLCIPGEHRVFTVTSSRICRVCKLPALSAEKCSRCGFRTHPACRGAPDDRKPSQFVCRFCQRFLQGEPFEVSTGYRLALPETRKEFGRIVALDPTLRRYLVYYMDHYYWFCLESIHFFLYGKIKWGKMSGYPQWPCQHTVEYKDTVLKKTWYCFFGDETYAKPESLTLKPFSVSSKTSFPKEDYKKMGIDRAMWEAAEQHEFYKVEFSFDDVSATKDIVGRCVSLVTSKDVTVEAFVHRKLEKPSLYLLQYLSMKRPTEWIDLEGAELSILDSSGPPPSADFTACQICHQCLECRKHFHFHCLYPPVSVLAMRRFVCSECTSCSGCGKRDPQCVPQEVYSQIVYLCPDCKVRYGELPTCKNCLTLIPKDESMLPCHLCSSQLHGRCIPSPPSDTVFCAECMTELLTDYLDHLIKADTYQIFCFPVDQSNAPLYNQIIRHPMDLSTMKLRIMGGDYSRFQHFNDDAELMLQNAFTYNQLDPLLYLEIVKYCKNVLPVLSSMENTTAGPYLPFILKALERNIKESPVVPVPLPSERPPFIKNDDDIDFIPSSKTPTQLAITSSSRRNQPASHAVPEEKAPEDAHGQQDSPSTKSTIMFNGVMLANVTFVQLYNPDSLYLSRRDVCLYCGALGLRDPCVFCIDCGNCFHTYCTGVSSDFTSFGWRCSFCKICEACGEPEREADGTDLILCMKCLRGFHISCVVPPLPAAASQKWFCNLCVEVSECPHTTSQQCSCESKDCWGVSLNQCCNCSPTEALSGKRKIDYRKVLNGTQNKDQPIFIPPEMRSVLSSIQDYRRFAIHQRMEREKLETEEQLIQEITPFLDQFVYVIERANTRVQYITVLNAYSEESPVSCFVDVSAQQLSPLEEQLRSRAHSFIRKCYGVSLNVESPIELFRLAQGAAAFLYMSTLEVHPEFMPDPLQPIDVILCFSNESPFLFKQFFEKSSIPAPVAPNPELYDQSIVQALGKFILDPRSCFFCGELGDREEQGRLLFFRKGSYCHVNCAYWSCENHETNSLVFLRNIDMHCQRATHTVFSLRIPSPSQRCTFCSLPGATLQCTAQRCSNTYHYRCARKLHCSFNQLRDICCPMHSISPSVDWECKSTEQLDPVFIPPLSFSDAQRTPFSSRSLPPVPGADSPSKNPILDSLSKQQELSSLDQEARSLLASFQPIRIVPQIVPPEVKSPEPHSILPITSPILVSRDGVVLVQKTCLSPTASERVSKEVFLDFSLGPLSSSSASPRDSSPSSSQRSSSRSTTKESRPPRLLTYAERLKPLSASLDHHQFRCILLSDRNSSELSFKGIYRLGALTVRRMGELLEDPHFCTEDCIIPTDFCSYRIFWSTLRPAERSVFCCEVTTDIFEGGKRPLYHLTEMDPDGFHGESITIELIDQIRDRILSINGSLLSSLHVRDRANFNVYGLKPEHFFGFGLEEVVHIIEYNKISHYYTIPKPGFAVYHFRSQMLYNQHHREFEAKKDQLLSLPLSDLPSKCCLAGKSASHSFIISSKKRRKYKEVDTLSNKRNAVMAIETKAPFLTVHRSRIHGWGLFSRVRIFKDEMVVEYVGELIREGVANQREQYYDESGLGSCYLFKLNSKSIVDSTLVGGLAKFINHSCEPNCYSRIVSDGREDHIVFFAVKDIGINEELTFDYKFPFEEERIPCNCGTPSCRGRLN